MKTLRELGQINTSLQQQKDAGDFVAIAHFMLKHGKFSEALRAVEENKLHKIAGWLTPRTLEIIKQSNGFEISHAALRKAAVPMIGITGSPLQDLSAISSGFVNSLASAGAFDAMLPYMAQIPLRGGSIGAVSVTANAYSVSEGVAKPVSKLSLTGTTAAPTKVHTALIWSQELAKMTDARALLERELRNVTAVASDDAMLDAITAGVVPATSFGTTASNVRADIEYLLRALGIKQTSKVFLITTPAMCATLSQKENNGEPAFPLLGPLGGEVSPGLPLLTTDACPAGYLIGVDATRIAGASSELILEEVEEAVIQADDTPDSPTATATTNLQSLWQLNLTGVRVERWILAKALTTNAVKIINNANGYVAGAGSP